MRITMKFLIAGAACLLLAGAVFAEVRPPVKFELVEPLEIPAEGEPVTGLLRIVSDVPGEITNIRMEGDGWTEIAIDAPDFHFADKAVDSPIIEFTIQQGPGARFVNFAFDFEGRTIPNYFDFTRETLLKMQAPGKVESAPVRGVDPGPSGDANPMAVPDDPAPNDKAIADDDGDPAGVARTIRVRGRMVYYRSDGVTVGADGLWVRVYDDDPISDDLLASVLTDGQGYYDVNIDTGDAGETNPDLYVHFESQNAQVDVKTTGGSHYAWQTAVNENYSGSDWNRGWITPSDETQHPSLHLLTNLSRTWKWLGNREGYDTPHVDGVWPNGDTGAWYNGSINISTDREWREDTHVHEYGHHWIANYAVQVAPDYCNGICDFDGRCGHCIWCQETDHDAFSEGWPNWLADIITRSFAGDYGTGSQFLRSQEDLDDCGGVMDDPLLTEGFLGALCRDIEDGTNDDHPFYAGFADALSLGSNEIFDVVDFDHPTTPIEFLNDFKARFPQHKEGLWETAKNCGYEIDVTAPGAPTNLTSSSHSTTGDSPDPTIRYTWTIPADDASGIAGYGIYISGSPGSPSNVQDIGDVSSYTTESLAPGTYYFNIKAVDRAGRWSTSYASYGPITIRAAEPSDLTYRIFTGWDYPIVPRNDNTATSGSVPVSPTLDGNAATTYWNMIGINQGESATSVGFYSRLFVDDVYTRNWYWGPIGAGGGFYGVNGGPFTVRGGRHTFEMRVDATELVAETVETNNRWARQFIWTPYVLTQDTPVNRATPPGGTDGWAGIVDGAVKWFNTDGLRFNTGATGWWSAVSLRAVDHAVDYDLRLHEPSTGSEDGFGTYVGYSSRAAGCLDAVIANRNVTGTQDFDAGVINTIGGSGDYVAEHVASTSFSFDDSLDVAMVQDEFIILKEFYVATSDTGNVSITVDVTGAPGPVYVQWLSEYFETGDLHDYSLQTVTDPGGRARLDFHVPEPGFNCLVIFRDPKDGGDPVDLVVEIQPTPPDLVPLELAGWHAPFVPRPAHDGTVGSVPTPTILHGNVASTYLNIATRNESPSSSPSLPVRIFTDGVFTGSVTWGFVPGFTNRTFNWDHGFSIRGGRHTFDMRLDEVNDIEEIHEDNNVYGEQWVWTPLEVPDGTQVDRANPPDRWGGWEHVTTTGALWYNCDGLRLPTRNGYWHAMAVMPGASSNVDIRLHPQSTGAKDGFGGNHAYSGWGVGQSDFVLVNYNYASNVPYDTGVLRIQGDQWYTAENSGATYLDSGPIGSYGTFTLASGSIVNLHEVYFDAGATAVKLVNESGNVDWGLSVYPAGTEFMGKSDALPGGSSWANGPGQDEMIADLNLPDSDYYCVVVWKKGSADLSQAGSYSLVFGHRVSDVPDGAAIVATGLHNIYPNPFNPQTTVVYDMKAEGRAEVAIYDLSGRLVRRLVNEVTVAGRHETVWNGTDDTGRRVASGVYMVRFRSGEVQQMRKLMLVK